MKKETPRSLKREAGLADGLTTVAPVAGMPTTGRDQRQKRSPQGRSAVPGTLIHGAASSSRSFRAGSRHWMGTSRRLGSGLQDRGRHWDSPAILAGAVRPMPSDNSHQPAKSFSQLLQTLRFLEERLRKMKITVEEIERAKTSKGGWTKEQLAVWGVQWPPPKGWKTRLLKNHQSDQSKAGQV